MSKYSHSHSHRHKHHHRKQDLNDYGVDLDNSFTSDIQFIPYEDQNNENQSFKMAQEENGEQQQSVQPQPQQEVQQVPEQQPEQQSPPEDQQSTPEDLGANQNQQSTSSPVSVTTSRSPFGPLSSDSYTLPESDGNLPDQRHQTTPGFTSTNEQKVVKTTASQLGGFGNNVPHHLTNQNSFAGVKMITPVHVRSLHYFDEDKPSVDGIQEASEVQSTRSGVYYSPHQGIYSDPTLCLSNNNQQKCVSNHNCGWCSSDERCVPGTYSGPSDGYPCKAGYVYFSHSVLAHHLTHRKFRFHKRHHHRRN